VGDLPTSVERLWVVAEGNSPEVRHRPIQALAATNWQILQKCDDFEGITIFLLCGSSKLERARRIEPSSDGYHARTAGRPAKMASISGPNDITGNAK
jgi:hypothetical protein